MSRERYPWGEMEWLVGAERGNATTVSLATMSVLPGKCSERHRHQNCDEVVWVQRGNLLIDRAGQTSIHRPGQCVVVRAGLVHQIRNEGAEELFLVLSYGAGRRDYEAC